MINHIATLLRNQDGPIGADATSDQPDIYVPESFRALPLSSSLVAIRRILFGSDPDADMLRLRTIQFLTVIHAAGLDDLVVMPDSRLTYDPARPGFSPGPEFRIRLTSPVGYEATLLGDAPREHGTGRLRYSWIVTVQPGALQIDRMAPFYMAQTATPDSNAGFYDPVVLPGSALKIRAPVNAPNGTTWTINALISPDADLADLPDRIAALPEEILLTLFGATSEEPFVRLRTIWNSDRSLIERLGALVLALAYRTGMVENFNGR